VDYDASDLFDIEKRPGAGVGLWRRGVERQFERVVEANFRHRRAHHPVESEREKDHDAEWHLHVEVYFLTLAIRRVVLFHNVLASKVADPRLDEALTTFEAVAPDATKYRNFYEHLDEYLLDSPGKHIPVAGRASPILYGHWKKGNVSIGMGDDRMDVTKAALAAVELGRRSEEVWEDERKRLSDAKEEEPLPPDDGIPRMLEVTMSRSYVIGDDGDPPVITDGTLMDVRIRLARPDEIERQKDAEA
jgi:hypothetical protein